MDRLHPCLNHTFIVVRLSLMCLDSNLLTDKKKHIYYILQRYVW